ncbi:unnamed protein product [Trichobilharzia szidati]|nr:unnamed protein product [Trichobilharzia szidati]
MSAYLGNRNSEMRNNRQDVEANSLVNPFCKFSTVTNETEGSVLQPSNSVQLYSCIHNERFYKFYGAIHESNEYALPSTNIQLSKAPNNNRKRMDCKLSGLDCLPILEESLDGKNSHISEITSVLNNRTKQLINTSKQSRQISYELSYSSIDKVEKLKRECEQSGKLVSNLQMRTEQRSKINKRLRAKINGLLSIIQILKANINSMADMVQ